MNDNPQPFLDEARQTAACCWCDENTKHITMDPALADAFAWRLASWMATVAQQARDIAYYQGLLDRCGAALGEQAYIADDGSRSDHVLRANVPELVEALVARK